MTRIMLSPKSLSRVELWHGRRLPSLLAAPRRRRTPASTFPLALQYAGRLTGSESDSDSESESSESDFKLPRSRPAYRLRQSSSLQLCPGPSGMPVMSPGPSQGHCQVALDQSKILTYSDVTPSSEFRSLVSLEFIHHLEGWDVLHNYFLLYNINIVT